MLRSLRVPQRQLLQLCAAVQPVLTTTFPFQQPWQLLRPAQHPSHGAAEARWYSAFTTAGENDDIGNQPTEAALEAPEKLADLDEEDVAVAASEAGLTPAGEDSEPILYTNRQVLVYGNSGRPADAALEAPDELADPEEAAAEAELAGADAEPKPEPEPETEGPSPVDGNSRCSVAHSPSLPPSPPPRTPTLPPPPCAWPWLLDPGVRDDSAVREYLLACSSKGSEQPI